MSTASQTEDRAVEGRPTAESEVPALAPERPQRNREATARLAAEAVQRVQGARRGWAGALRTCVTSLLRRLGR